MKRDIADLVKGLENIGKDGPPDWRMSIVRDIVFKDEIADIEFQLKEISAVRDDLSACADYLVSMELGTGPRGGARPFASIATAIRKVIRQKVKPASSASSAASAADEGIDALIASMSEASV